MRVVSFEEELLYLAKASQPLKDIAQIILDTGLRPEEAFRIRIENLDFAARTIFNPFGKTKAARRRVTMTTEVYRAHSIGAPRKRKASSVFPSRRQDRPIGSVRKAHDAAVERAGIKEHFRLYDLRHTFATRAVGRRRGSCRHSRNAWPHEDPDDDAIRSSGRGAEENRSREARDVSARRDRASGPKKSEQSLQFPLQ